jgi:hypothetical protein
MYYGNESWKHWRWFTLQDGVATLLALCSPIPFRLNLTIKKNRPTRAVSVSILLPSGGCSWYYVDHRSDGLWIYCENVSKSFRTESKYTLTTVNTRWKATQDVMPAKLTRLTNKTAIQQHLVAESWLYQLQFSLRATSPETLYTPSYVAEYGQHSEDVNNAL